jgi:hypothetical protein
VPQPTTLNECKSLVGGFKRKILYAIASGKWENNIKVGRKEINNQIIVITGKTALFWAIVFLRRSDHPVFTSLGFAKIFF